MAAQLDENIRTVLRAAIRSNTITVTQLCYDWPISLKDALVAVQTALLRGWLVEDAPGIYKTKD